MKIKKDRESLLAEYEKGLNYNRLTEYAEKCKIHKKFYLGDQWYGVNAPDLDKPVLNFIRRAVSYLTAMTAGEGVTAFLTPYVQSAENVRLRDILNTELERVIERSKLSVHTRRAVMNAAINGDGILYFLYDGKGVVCEEIDGTNIFYANPFEKDIQRQPYIIVAQRTYTEEIREKAANNGAKSDIIMPDGADGNISANPMSLLLTKFYKEDDKVYYIQYTKECIVTPPTDTGYTVYPFAKFCWDELTADCHGTGAVEHLIPNQIAVNKLWAMALLHEKTAAFPKIFYDRTKIDRWTNKVGTAIGVVGNPNDAVATSFRRQDMSSQVIELVEKTIRLTKEFMGASDVSLGDISPDNTSAILAVQKSRAIPLENQKQAFIRFAESCVIIILEIMKSKYGKRRVQVCSADGKYNTAVFDFGAADVSQMNFVIETDNSTPWAESIQMKTLENLFEKGILTDAYDFVSAIPQSRLKNKQRILAKLKTAMPNDRAELSGEK